MTDADLSKLRQEIDAIDDALHDLVMRRTSLVGRIIDAKNDGTSRFQPAREAQILRRLVDRHDGPFPRAALIRIWREIIAASLRLQGPFSVAAYAHNDDIACRDLAREHFGYTTPITSYQSSRAVVNAVGEGTATVGVLPMPEENETAPWWPALLAYPAGRPAIVARLPFAPAGESRGEWTEALVVGILRQAPSGRDRSFLLVQASPEVSRARLSGALGRVGMESIYMITRPDDVDPARTQFLIEVDGFVDTDDERLARLLEADDSPADEAVVLGTYAMPFTAAELTGEPAAGRQTPR